MKNKDLLNKTISTNEKVVLTYKDIEQKDYTVTLTSSPKIQLSKIIEELTATVSYDPTTETTGKVKATIKTNKKVNKVDGWTLSDDGTVLTKEFSSNTTETVHLVDTDNQTKDVIISINNIKIKSNTNVENKTVNTTTTNNTVKNTNITTNNIVNKNTTKNNITTITKLPNTGSSIIIIFILVGIVFISIVTYKKYKSYKDIK